MQFQVVGANAESGDDVDVMLEAPSEEELQKIAHDKGILVASVTPVAVAPKSHKKDDFSAISLVDDEPAAPASPTATPQAAGAHPTSNGHAPAAAPHANEAHPPERQQGIITTNASNPGDTAHSAAGHAHEAKHEDAVAHYHVILNQSLYLLESAVNKHLKDGWVVQGGIAVGVSNNAMQFFQGMLKPAKHATEKHAS